MKPSPIPLRTPLHLVCLAHAERARQWWGRGLRALAARWQRWRARRRTSQALQGLDDRDLHDLGLHRSEILSVAHGAQAHERRIRCD